VKVCVGHVKAHVGHLMVHVGHVKARVGHVMVHVGHVALSAHSRELEGVLVLVLVTQGAAELLIQLHGHLQAAAAG
jgi:hypothetical protein